MTLWEAALLGMVQGLTEFLPISSTAHLVVVREALGHESPEDAFTVVVQMGTLVAVLAYFRAEIVTLVRAVLRDLRSLKLANSPESRLAWQIAVGTIPVVIIGFLLKSWLKENFYKLPAMAAVAIVFAVLMGTAELFARRVRSPGSVVSWWQAIWIGCWQALALMPGASRSGTTITAGLFAGLSRPAAARFSFLLSLPAIVAAGVKELYDEAKKPNGLFQSSDEMLSLLVGLLVSAAVGYASIAWLLQYLNRHSTLGFIVYRLLFGIGILVYLLVR